MLMAVATKSRAQGRRPKSREMISESRTGLGAAFALIALVVIVELVDGGQARHIGVLTAAPVLAAALAPWRQVLAVGVVATVIGAVFSVPDATHPRQMVSNFVSVAFIVIGTAVGAVFGAYRQRQAERFVELSKLASAAQGAVLRPLGPQIGQLSIAARYISASAAADIGGDLYEALDTPYGVRMIIGDVRGKGLDAVRLASIVLGSYRHVAYERADLRAIVADLDRAVARSVGDEDFVTAALVEERGGTLTIVNCGHPPPLLLRRGEVIELTPPAPAPPLGFMPVVRPRVERLEPGDRLLFYTDGLAEARRDGEFFPTPGRAWGLLGHGTVADGLASLESALVEWVRGQLDDDIALVLMEYAGAHGAADPVPRWEIGGASSPALT
jgi:sigma-B regulation protein RsbU (phosphoserine phosphatase)